MFRWLLALLVAPGCIAVETSLARQELVHGSAQNGGIGFDAVVSTYRESGTDNISGGLAMQLLQQGPDHHMVGTMGLGARYARQLGASPDWRGFTRASFGLAGCQIVSCTDPVLAMQRTWAIGAQVGFERMLIAVDPQRPSSGSISAELGIAYMHSHDDMVGTGDFVGVALGLRVGVNMLSRPVTGGSR